VDSSAERSPVGEELPEDVPRDSYPESIDEGDEGVRADLRLSERDAVSIGVGTLDGFLARMDQLVRRPDPPGCRQQIQVSLGAQAS
jgi:hypothetical protein